MQSFDFDEDLKAIQSGKPITGSDGVLAPLHQTTHRSCLIGGNRPLS